jgi:HEAT repeat protein
VPPVVPVPDDASREAIREAAREAARQGAEAGRQAAEQARKAAEQIREATRNIGRGNDDYSQGQRDIDRREYEQAIRRFDRVIDSKSTRADGAMYWKAYSLYKLGRKPEAQTVLADLEKQFPQSRWLNDSRALAAEVRASTGQAASPESQNDEELKLLVMNSLMQQDPDRAIPLVQKLLNDPKSSPSLKERAIFVLASSKAPAAKQIVQQYAKGGTNPDAQLRAIEYLGTFRSDEFSQTLGEVYAASNDPAVKRAALRGLMVARAKDRIVQIAKTDSDPNMRKEAIRYLGGMQAEADLVPIYNSTTDKEVKQTVIQSLAADRAVKPLVDIAKAEKDPDIKTQIVRILTGMKSKEAQDYLIELLNK